MSKVKIIVGDITEFPHGIQAIFHGCNTLNIMGAGLALDLAQKYPCVLGTDTLVHDYWKENKVGESLLGQFSFCAVDDHPHVVYNLYQQKTLGAGALDYDALENAMNSAVSHCTKIGVTKIGVPFRIGCGLAGGDWNHVIQIIQDAAQKFDGDMYIVQRMQDIEK